MFFHCFVTLLAKAAGAEPARQMKDEELHAVVARSTFASQNVQNTSGSDRFWSARRCGAKHILKSKVAKHVGLRARDTPQEPHQFQNSIHCTAKSLFTFGFQQVIGVSGHDAFNIQLLSAHQQRRCHGLQLNLVLLDALEHASEGGMLEELNDRVTNVL